jgi:iron complex transport system substrate-binding protein
MRRRPAHDISSRFRLRIVAGVALSALLAAACAGDDSSDGAAASGEEVVAVEHRYGTTEVPTPPERIVSLDTQWTDVLAALDAPLVGYALDPIAESGTFPWREDRLADVDGIEITTDATIPYEQIAALDPDLVVITYGAQDEVDYRRLSEIAPTIPLLTENEVDAWQAIAAVAGEVLGEPERAADLIAEVDAQTADVRAQLPGLEGKTFAMANYVPSDAIYVVADPEDGSSVLFEQLGLQISPTILDHADDASGRVELSFENASLLDADVLVLFTNDADASEMPGYTNLPAVRAGAVAVLDYAAVVGLNTPTPLSIPYSLELIRPALEAAAAA